MKQIIVIKPGSITEENKQILYSNEYVVIEHDKPEEVRVISPFESFNSDDFIKSMIETISQTVSTQVKVDFVSTFFKKITNRK